MNIHFVRHTRLTILLLLVCLSAAPVCSAHGVLGQRFFPTTLAIEDPFAQDEFSLLVHHVKEPPQDGEAANLATEVEAEYAKTLLPGLALSLGGAYVHLDPVNGDRSRGGPSNLGIGLKYELLRSEAHEAILSIGLDAEIGDTGDTDAEADPFSTLSPAIFFGKGFGDLFAQGSVLRPFALTGALNVSIPTEASTRIGAARQRNPIRTNWGLALFYDLHYLQTAVRDVGLPRSLSRLMPIVETSFSTCMDRGCSGQTTGTVNPGVVWIGDHMQLGLEAEIPINDRTGKNVGVMFLVHLFLDDLFPNSLGRPLFGNNRP